MTLHPGSCRQFSQLIFFCRWIEQSCVWWELHDDLLRPAYPANKWILNDAKKIYLHCKKICPFEWIWLDNNIWQVWNNEKRDFHSYHLWEWSQLEVWCFKRHCSLQWEEDSVFLLLRKASGHCHSSPRRCKFLRHSQWRWSHLLFVEISYMISMQWHHPLPTSLSALTPIFNVFF